MEQAAFTRLPVVICDSEWPSFAAARTDAHYERLAVPGAYYDRKRRLIYCSERALIWGALDELRWARFLLCHEFGHAIQTTGHEHETTIRGLLRHAWRVRFDTRAGTRLLRWRWHLDSFDAYIAWEREARISWTNGSLRAMSVSQVLRMESSLPSPL